MLRIRTCFRAASPWSATKPCSLLNLRCNISPPKHSWILFFQYSSFSLQDLSAKHSSTCDLCHSIISSSLASLLGIFSAMAIPIPVIQHERISVIFPSLPFLIPRCSSVGSPSALCQLSHGYLLSPVVLFDAPSFPHLNLTTPTTTGRETGGLFGAITLLCPKFPPTRLHSEVRASLHCRHRPAKLLWLQEIRSLPYSTMRVSDPTTR